MSYIIYARKSTESEDRQALSIDSQIKELRELAVKREIHISKVYRESFSAKEPGRPVFSELMKEIQRGKLTGILCWKLDRLARNPIEGAAIIWALAKRQLSEIVMPGKTFTASSDDKLLMQIEFGMATKYIDDLSENVRRGKRAKLEQGEVPGPVPIGYFKDSETGKTVPDPIRFPLVRKIWELVVAGEPPMEVLRKANEDWGLRTRTKKQIGGRPLSPSSFYALLSHPFYTGMIRHDNKLYRGNHKPMVSHQEFDAVQTKLSRLNNRKTKTKTFTYSSLMYCGACGRMITAERKQNRYGYRYIYYHCSRKKPGYAICPQPSIEERMLEHQVASYLESISIPDKYFQWTTEALEKQLQSESQASTVALHSLEQSISTGERRIKHLLEMHLRKLLSDDEYRSEKQRTVLQLEKLREKRDSLSKGHKSCIESITDAFSFLKQANKYFRIGDPGIRRDVLKTLASNLFLRDKKLLIKAKKPLRALAELGDYSSTWDVQESNL